MLDLISKLLAIYNYAKDIHYRAKGEAFYGLHLFMDRISDQINDQIDELKEVYYLGRGDLPPKSDEILKVVLGLLPDYSVDTRDELINLEELLRIAIESVDDIKKTGEVANGVSSLIDDIAKTLMLKYGLLHRAIVDLYDE